MKAMTTEIQQSPTLRGPDDRDRLIDLDGLAERLTVSKRSVWRLVASGDLVPPVKIGRLVRWFEADIETYLDRKRQQRDSKRVAFLRHRVNHE